MGRIAATLADRAIITDDNPRSEDPAAIRQEILAEAPGAEEIGDRGAAIATAVAAMGPGDVLFIAGKGHESGQLVGGQVLRSADHTSELHSLMRLSYSVFCLNHQYTIHLSFTSITFLIH